MKQTQHFVIGLKGKAICSSNSKKEMIKMWNKIEPIMRAKGLNQNQLAKKMGIRNSVISDLKSGYIKKPRFELMEKFADALDVSLDEFRDK